MGLRERRTRQPAIISRSSKSGSIATAGFDMAQPPPPPPSLLPPEVAGGGGGGDGGGDAMTVMASGADVVFAPALSVATAVRVRLPMGAVVQVNE